MWPDCVCGGRHSHCHNSTASMVQLFCWPVLGGAMDQTYFASLIAVILTRATERILLVLVGALAIYLGYSLFRQIPNVTKGAHLGEGKIELPGGVSIFLTRIGPGVFFALFGIAVIGYSVTKPIQFSLPPASDTVASGGVTYSGASQRDVAPQRPPGASIAGPEPEIVIARLNGFYQEAQKRLSTPQAAELAVAIRAAKFSIMLGRWKPEWGDRAKFESWARDHGDKDLPREIGEDAFRVFNTVL